MGILKMTLVIALLAVTIETVSAADAASAVERRKIESELKALESQLNTSDKTANKAQTALNAEKKKQAELEKRKQALKDSLSDPKFMTMEERLARLEAKNVEKAKPTEAATENTGEDEDVSGVEVSFSIDMASAYVFRGSTFNDGAVLQPGIEIGGLPITVGVWANFDIDDYDGAANDGQFSEIDIFASYTLPIPSELLEVSVAYCEYTYPGAGGDPTASLDADGSAQAEGTFGVSDREAAISFGLDLPLAPSVAINYGIEGGIEKDLYVEACIAHELELGEVTVELGAALGFLSPDEGESGLSHANVSASCSYKMLSVSVTSVNSIDDDVLPDVEDGGSYDVGVYAIVGVSQSF